MVRGEGFEPLGGPPTSAEGRETQAQARPDDVSLGVSQGVSGAPGTIPGTLVEAALRAAIAAVLEAGDLATAEGLLGLLKAIRTRADAEVVDLATRRVRGA